LGGFYSGKCLDVIVEQWDQLKPDDEGNPGPYIWLSGTDLELSADQAHELADLLLKAAEALRG
jgi:hypothetical protein